MIRSSLLLFVSSFLCIDYGVVKGVGDVIDINAVKEGAGDVIELTPQQFYDGVTSNLFNATIDVRTQGEWDLGHIENATFVENMAQFTVEEARQVLEGCEGECLHMALYCRSGRRSGLAINLLQRAGYNGTLYNGQGVSQWQSAGFPLVSGDSVDAKCFQSANDFICEDAKVVETTNTPTISPTQTQSSCIGNFDEGCINNDGCCSNICDTRFTVNYCKAERAIVSRQKRRCRSNSRGGSRCEKEDRSE